MRYMVFIGLWYTRFLVLFDIKYIVKRVNLYYKVNIVARLTFTYK